jgi:hypothetical protein
MTPLGNFPVGRTRQIRLTAYQGGGRRRSARHNA